MPEKTLIVLVGPTAIGKTKVSITLAKKLFCSIVNADSRQIFKEMSIGTAKPTREEMQDVKHYFVDDRSIAEDFSAGQFEREGLKVIRREFESKDVCLLSGGSGLYIDALCLGLNEFPAVNKGIRKALNQELEHKGVDSLYQHLVRVDSDYASEIEANNSQRIIRALEVYRSSGQKYSDLRLGMNSQRDFNMIYIGLEMPRDQLYARINSRMDDMIANGLFEEALSLEPFREKNALQTVGYNEIFMFKDGLIDRKETIRLLKRNSRRYAKRQLTWFKRNKEITWFQPEEVDAIYSYLQDNLHT